VASTYGPIASTTLGSAASDITFSSIGSTFTDLILVVTATPATSATNVRLQVNADTGSNYSNTTLYGSGSSAASARESSIANMLVGYATTTDGPMYVVQFMSYANTSVYKTALVSAASPAGYVERTVNLWRSTSAITSIKLFMQNGNNIAAGATASLYRIKAA